MKKVFLQSLSLGIIFLMIATTFSACGSKETDKKANDSIKIGVSAAITGPAPLDGERTVQGINLALKEINAKGGINGRSLKVVVEDDQNMANIAVNAINKLVNDPKIVAIMGPNRSANVMAVEQIMGNAKIPFVTTASSPKLTTIVSNPYLFRIRASDTFVGQIIAKFALETLNATKIGVIFNNDDYGTGGRNTVVDYLRLHGVEPAVVEGHNTNDKDMTGVITRCKDAGVDCLVVYTHDPEAAIFTRQRYEMGLNVPIVGPATFSLPTFLGLVTAEETQDVYSVSEFVASNPDPLVSEFKEKFFEEYNVDPDLFAASYYLSTYVLADALKRCEEITRENLRKALLETKDYHSIYGTLYANEKGELEHSLNVAKIINNAPEFFAVVHE